MIDEYGNKKAPEINPQHESKALKENFIALENKPVLENQIIKENKEFDGKSKPTSSKDKARNRAMAVLTSSLAGVIGLVVVGMTNLINVKMKADFEEVEYRDGKIVYSINVKDMTDKEYLIVYPERDSKKIDGIKLVDEDGDGFISGEFEVDKEYIEKKMEIEGNVNIQYVLNLRGLVGLDVERLFDRYVVNIDKFESHFDEVTGHCECGVDGYYHFTMHFSDDGGLFSNFEAYIIDELYTSASEEEKENHIAHCTFSDNLHDEQKIFVDNLSGSKGKLVIKYNKDGEADKIVREIPIEF